MHNISWYFPESLKKVTDFLGKGIPHGGGTSILRMNMTRIDGLIDLGRLGLDFFKKEGKIIRIGASLTYADVVKNIRKIDPEHILYKALVGAASESLRNRITVGGSIASFRPWSDIMGPLLALEVEVSLFGKEEGLYPIKTLVENSELQRENLIIEVRFRDDVWASWYGRQTRTSFDYAIFTLTILLKKVENRIDDIRIVLVGTKKRFLKLNELEDFLRDKHLEDVDVDKALSLTGLDFPRKQRMSNDYIEHLAKVQLERGLKEVLRR
jgi:CO/xanthine dehydrogenase FAD-binding subunit